MRDGNPGCRGISANAQQTRHSFRWPPGQALVETAIGIVLLVLVTLSIVDAAWLFYGYLTLQNGVTEATRFAVTGQSMDDPSNPASPLSHKDAIMHFMRSVTPGIDIEDSEFGFTDLTDPTVQGVDVPTHVIQVTVTHRWPLINPMLRPFVGGDSITLRVSATMKNEPFPTSPSS
jgi:Flp pilus assembly protein TadG